MTACPKRADVLHLGNKVRRLTPRGLLGLLCLLLLVLPLIFHGLLDIWVSQTPLAVRAQLLQMLSWLAH